MAAKKHKFKTETQKLLDLVIHSLYSHPDIFLREIISNASDACDRLRLQMLSDKSLKNEKSDFKIKIIRDEKSNTLTISDNGLGMNEEELLNNLGTIARSGTKNFLESLKQKKDNPEQIELIGQFGVGFYSSFMVSSRVIVETRKAGEEESFRWESDGSGSFTIDKIDKKTRGTDIIIHLKDEFKKYLEDYEIKSIVKKYSDYIEYPVLMDVEKYIPKKDDEKEPKKEIEEETLNSQKAIWTRSPKEVKEDEYKEFYKQLTHDYTDHYAKIHYRVEGVTEYTALLFIPAKAPFDLMFAAEKFKGIHLYVKRIFIMDDAEALMPRYLRFVKGVLDSSDLPLNVSREILQQDKLLAKIKTNLVKKVLDTLAQKKEKDKDKYLDFFKELGGILKEGLASDFENQKKIMELLLFESTSTKPGEYVSLDEYVKNMPSDQKEIYYITGESRAEVENSPHLEAFNKKKFEVLYLTDSIDELISQHMNEYEGKKIKSVLKGDLDLSSTEEEKESNKKALSEKQDSFKGLLELIQKKLDENVKEVRLANRLVSSPACLVTDEFGMSSSMERLMKSMNQNVPKTKRIFELNPDHSIIKLLNELYVKDRKKTDDYIVLLYNQALIAEGGKLDNPDKFSGIFSNVMEENIKTLIK